jgi:hypothetical protein
MSSLTNLAFFPARAGRTRRWAQPSGLSSIPPALRSLAGGPDWPLTKAT